VVAIWPFEMVCQKENDFAIWPFGHSLAFFECKKIVQNLAFIWPFSSLWIWPFLKLLLAKFGFYIFEPGNPALVPFK